MRIFAISCYVVIGVIISSTQAVDDKKLIDSLPKRHRIGIPTKGETVSDDDLKHKIDEEPEEEPETVVEEKSYLPANIALNNVLSQISHTAGRVKAKVPSGGIYGLSLLPQGISRYFYEVAGTKFTRNPISGLNSYPGPQPIGAAGRPVSYQVGYSHVVVNGQRAPRCSEQEKLASHVFGSYANEFDPRNDSSQYEWGQFSDGTVFDRAAIVKRYGYSELTTIPHSLTGTDQTNGFLDSFEAQVLVREAVEIGDNDIIVNSLKFQSNSINTEKHPFPRRRVSNGQDDLRLAHCGLGLTLAPENGQFLVIARLVTTNEGVWALLEVDPQVRDANGADYQAFSVARHLADKASPDQVIIGAVAYGKEDNSISWFINGFKVWTVSELGVVPDAEADNYVRLITDNGGVDPIDLEADPITTARATFGCGTKLDALDPNNPESSAALVRLSVESAGAATPWYADDFEFVDDDSLLESRLFQQGTTAQLYAQQLWRLTCEPRDDGSADDDDSNDMSEPEQRIVEVQLEEEGEKLAEEGKKMEEEPKLNEDGSPHLSPN